MKKRGKQGGRRRFYHTFYQRILPMEITGRFKVVDTY